MIVRNHQLVPRGVFGPRRRSGVWAAALLVTLGMMAAAAATHGAPAVASEPAPFRAVVLVSSGGGWDTVSMLFTPPAAEDEVRQIVSRMSEVGGWEIADLHIEQYRFVSAWDEATQKNPGGERQTFVEFAAAPVVNHRQRWIALDPFIVGLQDYSPLRVMLALGEGVEVEGPGDFENNAVKIECSRAGNSIAYDITVKEPNLVASGAPAHPAPRPPSAAPRARGAAALLALLVAVGTLALAGLVLTRLWKGWWPWEAKNRSSRCAVGCRAPQAQPGSEGRSKWPSS